MYVVYRSTVAYRVYTPRYHVYVPAALHSRAYLLVHDIGSVDRHAYQ